MKPRFALLLICLTFLCTSGTLGQTENATRRRGAPSYRITDLGHLDAGFASYAKAINNRGEIVGSDNFNYQDGQNSTISAPRAFLYRDHSMHDLGSLGGNASAARAINERGQNAATPADPYGLFSTHVFFYDGTMHDLGTLGGSIGTGFGINDRGFIVGGSSLGSSNFVYHAFLYDGSMHDLGTLDGMANSQANGINDRGQIVGTSYSDTIPTTFQAFLYDGAFHALGTLGGSNSYAYAINNKGIIVGESNILPTGVHAFLYDGSMHDLGALNNGSTTAEGVNQRGQVVGQWNYSVGGTQETGAFLSENGNLYDLKKLLDSSGDEWTYLIEATSINERGEIVGTGVKQDGIHAFRMDPKARCDADDQTKENECSNLE